MSIFFSENIIFEEKNLEIKEKLDFPRIWVKIHDFHQNYGILGDLGKSRVLGVCFDNIDAALKTGPKTICFRLFTTRFDLGRGLGRG